MTDKKLHRLVLAALFTALTTVMTMVIQVPSPMQGYVNLGDCGVLLSAWVLGPAWGGAARKRQSRLRPSLSLSFILFPRGQPAPDVPLRLVFLQNLLGLEVQGPVERRETL